MKAICNLGAHQHSLRFMFETWFINYKIVREVWVSMGDGQGPQDGAVVDIFSKPNEQYWIILGWFVTIFGGLRSVTH